MSFCTKCGHPRDPVAQYCTGCGAPFRTEPGSEGPAAQPAAADPAQPDGAYADRPPGSFAPVEQPAAPVSKQAVSDETGYDPLGSRFDHDAEPAGPPSAVPGQTYASTERDAPMTTVLADAPRPGAGTSTSQRGSTSAMPTRRREPPGPTPPAGNDPSAPPASWWRRRWPVAAAATLVVAGGAAAAALLLTHGHHAEQTAAQNRAVASGTPSQPATPATSAASAAAIPATVPSAEAAARNLDTVLMHYSTQRGDLQAAVNHVSQCQNVTAEANVIAGIAASRKAELGRLSSIDWATMPSGPTMQADLTTALQDSRLADQDYQRWATGLEASCQPPAAGGTSFTAADTASAQAVAAKAAFLPLWRPVAARYALASRNLLATQL